MFSVREFTGFCRQIWCVDTCLLLVKSRVFPFVKNTCFLHVYSPDCRTWIHGILSTNLVCRHVFTAREITSFSIREKHVFSARVFTWLPYVNSRDSVDKFGVSTRVYCSWNHEFFHSWKTRVFCTCIHLIAVREFTRFCQQIWCVDTCLLLVKSRVFPFVRITCFLYVYSPDCRTWIHGILWTHLVYRHVITSLKSRVSVRVFTRLSYVNSQDSMNTFGV